MIDQLNLLAEIITDAVADADCEVGRIAVTAGRPAAPSGEDCPAAIYIYADNITDLNQVNDEACIVRSRHAMQYEIWTCYPEAWEDQYTTEVEAAAAECLYELMGLVWCALVEAKDDGLFCDDCSFVEVEPLIVQPRQGGVVSALGGVTLPFVCPAPAVSPSSP